jgi:mRNA interferase HigB
MRVVGRQLLSAFAERHPPARSWIAAWLREVEAATWTGPQEVKDRYRSASFLSDNKIVFNVKGNSYRLEVQVSYENSIVCVLRCGTHAEYDRWNP